MGARTRITGRTAVGGAAVLGVLLAGTGCSDPATAPDAEPAAGPATTAEGSSDSGTDEGGTDEGGMTSGAGVRDQDLQEVLVEQTVSLPGSPEDEVTLGVQSLTVEGEVMVLRMVMTPDFASVSASETVSVFDALDRQGFRPTLVDRENLKEYSLVSDSGITWASESVQSKAVNGSPIPVWGVFAAPEDDIDAVDLRVLDVWPEFTDVPLTR